MRLDHVSYVASHDQISDVVNRIGSQIGTAFVDGGIHPKFGTRNFTAPLLNGQYIEIVCPLDHPATDTTPFGQAVKKKADAGGGWLAWVISTDDMDSIEELLQFLFHLNFVEGFYDIKFVDVIVVFDLHTAIKSFGHFFYVVFESF